jgi:hypothetical protein
MTAALKSKQKTPAMENPLAYWVHSTITGSKHFIKLALGLVGSKALLKQEEKIL